MKNVRGEIIGYLQGDSPTMQLATVRGGKPRVCTVWFVADEDMNLYWLSYPSRQHSQDIAADPHVAAAVVVKPDEPTIGLQISGTAEGVLNPQIIKDVMERYQAKYHKGDKFLAHFQGGTNKHQLYCLKPAEISLFDEENFPGGEKQTVHIN